METRTIRPKKSVRRAARQAALPPPETTIHHRTRRERERQRNLRILIGAIAVIVIIILVPVYGYYREVIRLGDHAAAIVDGRTITLEDEARYVGARQGFLGRQIAAAQPTSLPTAAATTTAGASPAASTPSTTPAATTTPTTAEQAASKTLQALQSEQASLTSTGIDSLVEANLINDEAKTRGMTVSQTELDNGLRWLLSPHAPATASGIDPVPATLPVTGTISLDTAKQDETEIVNAGPFLTADQITEEIVKPAVFKTKLIDALSTGPVATTEEEVHARHILVATLEEAQAAKKQIDDGAKFEDVAAKVSTDTGSKANGGDLGWFGKGQMVPEFEQAAFSLPVGKVSDPVKSQFGYHIIQVLEKDPNHPVDPSVVEQHREQGYQSWLSKTQGDQTKVTFEPTSTNGSNWVRDYVAKTS